MALDAPPQEVAAALNRGCACETLDQSALASVMDAALDASATIDYAKFFARSPAFVAHSDLEAMTRIVEAIEAASELPGYRQAVGARGASEPEFGPRGVFMGYDFHIADAGPRLIEANTNAGGAFLNAAFRAAQTECCPQMKGLGARYAQFEDAIFAMFLEEWRRAGNPGAPERVAIVDDDPSAQFLYAEFKMAAALFRRRGIEAAVVDAAELEISGGKLIAAGAPADLVYNRLVDFDLSEARHGALRSAWLSGSAVVTPAPDRHALLADKRNLMLLGDAERLRSWGLSRNHAAALSSMLPVSPLDASTAETLWADRRRYVFKPAGGYGAKAVYRGDKLTRRVWEEIRKGGYIAQEFAPPGERLIRRDGAPTPLKMDVRVYAYAARPLMLAARLYEGQTTNFRTPGGGFSPVHVI
jgi:hypothetical protein